MLSDIKEKIQEATLEAHHVQWANLLRYMSCGHQRPVHAGSKALFSKRRSLGGTVVPKVDAVTDVTDCDHM